MTYRIDIERERTPLRCQICKRRSEIASAGFTLIELLIVVAIIAILAAVATPTLLRARQTSNEASAIGSLRALNSAQSSYAAAAAHGAFAPLMATLAAPCPGATDGFISPDLADDPVVKSGYTITMAAATDSSPGPTDCNGTATRTAYYVTAVPVAGGLSGIRGFASSAGGAIFFDITGAAPTEAQMAPGGGGKTIQ